MGQQLCEYLTGIGMKIRGAMLGRRPPVVRISNIPEYRSSVRPVQFWSAVSQHTSQLNSARRLHFHWLYSQLGFCIQIHHYKLA